MEKKKPLKFHQTKNLSHKKKPKIYVLITKFEISNFSFGIFGIY